MFESDVDVDAVGDGISWCGLCDVKDGKIVCVDWRWNLGCSIF